MAKKNVSEIEKGAGFFTGLITELMAVVREKEAPFAVVYRLVTPEGRKTLAKIVDIAYADWQAEQPNRIEQQPQGVHPYSDAPTNGNTLPPNHYRVHVTYAPLPSINALKKEWGKDNVSVIFDGRPFNFHASCVGMDRTPGVRTFYVHDAGGDWESEEQIAWGLAQRNAVAPNGYRPATHEEFYEFTMAHPELLDFVGLSSFALDGGFRCVARVWQYGRQRVLGSGWFDCGWNRSSRVLFVSK